MLKQYFQKITLFTILAFLSCTGFIIVAISRQAEEIKSDLLYKLGVFTVAFVSIDILLKQVLKLKTAWVWISQILLLIMAVYIWIVS